MNDRRRMVLGTLARISMPLVLLAGAGMTQGCRALQSQMDGVDMSERIKDAPSIRLDSVDSRHLLVMQAPNPGWSIEIDRTEIVPNGQRVYITIRRPDPAFMYPQVIVEKRVLSEVQAEVPLIIMARLLDAHEKGKGRSYSLLEPVEQFQD